MMDPLIFICILFAVAVLVIAIIYRMMSICDAKKERSDASFMPGSNGQVEHAAPVTEANEIYNPGYNERAIAASPNSSRSQALLRAAAELSPNGRPSMQLPGQDKSPQTILVGPEDPTDDNWVDAYMKSREVAEQNEYKITGVKPTSFEPQITIEKKILPPLKVLTEEYFYGLPTKMIPMDQNRPEHADLNRYRNILPYNRSWVQLTCPVGVGKDPSKLENFQYINANYIPNFSGTNKREYIACQGPKSNGLPQFWRLIWQENIRTIAMLTGLVEKGKNKCAQYWPGQKGQEIVIPGFKITCLSASRFGSNAYITTELIVTTSTERRKVTHFWFDAWPDLGVPSWKDGQSLQQLLKDARKLNARTKGGKVGNAPPQVIHCSAGIGRTGVLIALDRAMDTLERHHQDTFDLMKTTDLLRNHRGGMIQTWEQAIFLLELIHKAFPAKKKKLAKKPVTPESETPPVEWHIDNNGLETTSEFV